VRAKPDEQEAVRAKADERTAEGIDKDRAAERAEKAFAGQVWAEGAERPAGGPVGAFQRHWKAWVLLPMATKQVRAWARDGYYVEPGPAWTAPLRGVVNEEWNAAAGEQERWMDEELARWASIGVCEEVQDEELMRCPGIYHPLKVADKPGWEQLVGEAKWRKKYRLCVAVRKAFNRSLPDVRTHLEGLAEALRILRDGDKVCKSDAEMGYFHVALHPACRRYFRFRRGRCGWCSSG
jgi:hypothetical protein